VTVSGTEAVFSIDGVVVGRYTASDMPGDFWTTGEMKSFVNLWCVDTTPLMEAWAGKWIYPGEPLVGRVAAVGYQAPGGSMELIGSGTPTPTPKPTVTVQGTTQVPGTVEQLYDVLQRSDVLEGAGGQDQFHFVPGTTLKTRGGSTEHDIILDFNSIEGADHDVVVISKVLAGVKGFSNLYRNITDVDGDAVLRFADGSTLTFDGLRKADLGYDDFLLVA
jgi:hypothetical protein